MALRYCDSFDTYAIGDIGLHWTYTTFTRGYQSIAEGRSGNGLTVAPPGAWSDASYVGKLFDSQPTWTAGLAWWCNNLGNAGSTFIVSIQDSGTEQVGLYCNGLGQFYLTKNGGLIAGTYSANNVVRQSAWNYVELQVKNIGATATATVKVNGQTVISYSGNLQQSANASANEVFFGFWDYVMSTTIDDLYICDGTGSVNNDFLGDVRIQPLFPATSVLSQFTASGASANWLCVKEHAEDGDTTFVYTASGAQADLYGKDQITGYTGGIPGIYLRTIVRKDDAGTRIVAPILTSGTATGIGPQTSLSNSYVTADAVFETDPNTSAAWTLAALNAAAIGVSAVQ